MSIIIPVYNVEDYLPKCLDSVLAQTYENLQIIVVNDGTKDNSDKIIREYQGKDDRIVVVEKENGGLSSARNAGLVHATGVYCFFLDSDDYIEPDLLKKAIGKMQEEKADMVVFDYQRFYEDGREDPPFGIKDGVDVITTEQERLRFLAVTYYQYQLSYEVWNKIYRMDIIRKHHIQFENNYVVFAEDLCFNSYYFMYAKKVVRISDCLHHYLIRSSSITGAGMLEPKMQQFHTLLGYIYHYAKKHCTYLGRHFEYLYTSLMHDQYKRVSVEKIPEYARQVEENKLFQAMSQRSYASRKNFIAFYGVKLGDLLKDESYFVYHRKDAGKVKRAAFYIKRKRRLRTGLKHMLSIGGRNGRRK